MLFFLLLSAAIVLIDLSGGKVGASIMSLIYVSDDVCTKTTMEVDTALPAEAIASQAQDCIFGKESADEKTK